MYNLVTILKPDQKQAHGGKWQVYTWFLEIVLVRQVVCLCMCASAPKAINK